MLRLKQGWQIFAEFAGWNITFCWFYTPLTPMKGDIYWFPGDQQQFQHYWKGEPGPQTDITFLQSHQRTIFPTDNLFKEATSSSSGYDSSLQYEVHQRTQQEIIGLYFFIYPAFILKNKHKPRALDQRQLPIPKWFPRANTCLAGWQSLLQCKWRGTSHRRCHWRRGHQNQTQTCTAPHICTPNPPMLLLQLCGFTDHCRFVTHSEVCTSTNLSPTKISSYLLSLSSRWVNSTFFSIAFAKAAMVL